MTKRYRTSLFTTRSYAALMSAGAMTSISGVISFNDSSLMVRAAIDGAGVIYTAEEAIRAEVASRRLEIVLAPFAATSAGFYLYYPSQSQALPKLRAFIEHVRAQRAA